MFVDEALVRGLAERSGLPLVDESGWNALYAAAPPTPAAPPTTRAPARTAADRTPVRRRVAGASDAAPVGGGRMRVASPWVVAAGGGDEVLAQVDPSVESSW